MIIKNLNIKKMENYAIWMEIVYMKTKDFYGDIAKDVEKKLTHQIM